MPGLFAIAKMPGYGRMEPQPRSQRERHAARGGRDEETAPAILDEAVTRRRPVAGSARGLTPPSA
jgi:hypothetical protein